MSLKQISFISQYLDADGKTTVDILNQLGTVILPRGAKPAEKLKKMYLFVRTRDYIEYPDTEKSPPARENKPVKFNSDPDKKKAAEQSLGREVVRQYEEFENLITDIFAEPGLSAQNVQSAEKLVENSFRADKSSLLSCVQSLRTADTYTFHHSMSVCFLFIEALADIVKYSSAREFYEVFLWKGGKINLAESFRKQYSLGALLHDFGKTRINDSILNKNSRLTDEEFSQMKKHPQFGVDDLKKSGLNDEHILHIVGDHHQQYPVFNERHPLAVICNVVDVYDACRAERVYKEKFSFEQTKKILWDEMEKKNWYYFLFKIIITDTLSRLDKNYGK